MIGCDIFIYDTIHTVIHNFITTPPKHIDLRIVIVLDLLLVIVSIYISMHLSLSSFPDFKVRVELIENKKVCSSASRRGRYRQEVNVASSSTRAVPFVIIPMKEGHLEIEVKAAVKGSSSLYDGVKKNLLVVVRQTLVFGLVVLLRRKLNTML